MKKRKKPVGILLLIFILIFVGGGYYVYNMEIFEQNPPKIKVEQEICWNLKKPIEVKLSDESGIKFINVSLSDGKNSINLVEKVLEMPQKKYNVEVKFPKTGLFAKTDKFILTVEVVDSSKWNFFSGNKAIAQSYILIDAKRPELYNILSSYGIKKGGAALVVFKAGDKNLKDLYVQTNFGKKFYPTPFYKEGYYASLLAWPLQQESFRAHVIATDKAGNISKTRVKLFLKKKRYKISKINLSERLLGGKITDLAEDISAQVAALEKIEKFKYINEKRRQKSEKIINEVASKISFNMLSDFLLNPFYPLKNAAAVASFGDHRFYLYDGKTVSESYHLGLDLASVRVADIKMSNSGKVVYADYNGIYGNNLIVDHGLGLSSLYGHCSAIDVSKGDEVEAGEVVAKTGKTGLALGDHLHFGVLVQGVEVRPEEWMDKQWMKINIEDIIKNSKKIIDRQ